MARRIAVAVLTLIIALLAAVAIPLGLLIAAQDRRDFRSGQSGAASILATVAEERLDDGVQGTALARSIRQLGRQDDRFAVYTSPGQLIAATRHRPAPGPPGRRPVATLRTFTAGNRLVVLAPVVPAGGTGSPAPGGAAPV